MKTLLTLFFALCILTYAGLGIAQQPKEKKPVGEERLIDKSSPKLMTGKVMQVDSKARTFTIVAKGKEHRFNLKGGALPKVGDIVDVTFTESTGGPMEAINLNSSKSNIY